MLQAAWAFQANTMRTGAGYTISNDQPVRLLVITSPVREASEGGWGGFVADMEKTAQGRRSPF